jgi:tRNA(Ile)-lysidine synthetase-like protein
MDSSGLQAALAQSPVWDGLDGGACIVACSGGRDSIALALAACELLQTLEFTKRFTTPPQLALWHLDHGLRHNSSEDAAFVERFAEAHGIPCILERAELAAAPGNTEANARQERYQRLRRLLAEPIPVDGLPQPRRALTAHHLGDQAETVLHHLVRGTHLRGLRAIAPVFQQLIFRPWLDQPPEAIARYLVQQGQDWREDPTNSDLSLTRNRLRFNIIPELRMINPQAREHIARLATIAQDVQAVVDQQVEQLPVKSQSAVSLMPWLPVLAAPRGRYHTHFLAEGWEHPSLLAEFCARQLAAGAVPLAAADYELLSEWTLNPGQPCNLQGVKLRLHQRKLLVIAYPVEPRNYCINIGLILNQPFQHGHIFIKAAHVSEGQWSAYQSSLRLPWEFIRDWADFLISRSSFNSHSAAWHCFLPQQARPPFALRNWQQGDMIHLTGGGTKKLGDIFTDTKVPEHFRASWAVLLDAEGHIVWVPGLADSSLMNLPPNQSPAYYIRLAATE